MPRSKPAIFLVFSLLFLSIIFYICISKNNLNGTFYSLAILLIGAIFTPAMSSCIDREPPRNLLYINGIVFLLIFSTLIFFYENPYYLIPYIEKDLSINPDALDAGWFLTFGDIYLFVKTYPIWVTLLLFGVYIYYMLLSYIGNKYATFNNSWQEVLKYDYPLIEV